MTVDAIYVDGVFQPLGDVSLAENERVRLTIEPCAPPTPEDWMEAVKEFHRQVTAKHGVLPDSTPDIASDRRRHE